MKRTLAANAAPVEPSKTDLLIKWEAATKALAAAKEIEMALRLQVTDAWFPSHKEEGTENVPLENGYKLKAVFKQNYTLADLETVDAALIKMEAIDAEGKFIAERLIKFTPKLSVKEYKDCPEKYRKYIDDVLTIKPATPALELVEPKSARASANRSI